MGCETLRPDRQPDMPINRRSSCIRLLHAAAHRRGDGADDSRSVQLLAHGMGTDTRSRPRPRWTRARVEPALLDELALPTPSSPRTWRCQPLRRQVSQANTAPWLWRAGHDTASALPRDPDGGVRLGHLVCFGGDRGACRDERRDRISRTRRRNGTTRLLRTSPACGCCRPALESAGSWGLRRADADRSLIVGFTADRPRSFTRDAVGHCRSRQTARRCRDVHAAYPPCREPPWVPHGAAGARAVDRPPFSTFASSAAHATGC